MVECLDARQCQEFNIWPQQFSHQSLAARGLKEQVQTASLPAYFFKHQLLFLLPQVSIFLQESSIGRWLLFSMFYGKRKNPLCLCSLLFSLVYTFFAIFFLAS